MIEFDEFLKQSILPINKHNFKSIVLSDYQKCFINELISIKDVCFKSRNANFSISIMLLNTIYKSITQSNYTTLYISQHGLSLPSGRFRVNKLLEYNGLLKYIDNTKEKYPFSIKFKNNSIIRFNHFYNNPIDCNISETCNDDIIIDAISMDNFNINDLKLVIQSRLKHLRMHVKSISNTDEYILNKSNIIVKREMN